MTTKPKRLRQEVAVRGYPGIFKTLYWSETKGRYVDPRSIRGCRAKPFRVVKRVKVLGRWKKVQAMFDTIDAARAWRDKTTKTPQARVTHTYTLGDLIEEWQRWSIGRYRESTREQYAKEVKHMALLMRVPVEALTAYDIDCWLQQLIDPGYPKPKSRTSFRREVTSLKTILNWYRERKNSRFQPPILKRHKQDAVFTRRAQARKLPLTEEQLEDVLDWLKVHSKKPVYYYLAALQALSGPRIGEACGLMWKDMDWQNQRYTIQRIVWWSTKTSKPKLREGTKTDEIRVVKICPRLLELLNEWQEHGKRCEFVFHSDGKLLTRTAIQNAYNQAFERLGLPQRATHVFRHTFATIHADQTKDIRATQGALGHKDLRTTQHYASVSERTQAQALGDFRLGQSRKQQPTPPGGNVIPLKPREARDKELSRIVPQNLGPKESS